MSETNAIYVKDYVKMLSPDEKIELAEKLKKRTSINYVYQLSAGTNTPRDRLTQEVIVNFSKANKKDGFIERDGVKVLLQGCYVSFESMKEGFDKIHQQRK